MADDTPDPEVAPPPTYDPEVHTDPDELVHVQLFCRCGGVWRQIDPVHLVEAFVRDWLKRHPEGEEHGPATIAEFVEERETRKHAALRAVGKAHEYQPKTYATLDATCTAPRPWPVLADQDDQEG